MVRKKERKIGIGKEVKKRRKIRLKKMGIEMVIIDNDNPGIVKHMKYIHKETQHPYLITWNTCAHRGKPERITKLLFRGID